MRAILLGEHYSVNQFPNDITSCIPASLGHARNGNEKAKTTKQWQCLEKVKDKAQNKEMKEPGQEKQQIQDKLVAKGGNWNRSRNTSRSGTIGGPGGDKRKLRAR